MQSTIAKKEFKIVKFNIQYNRNINTVIPGLIWNLFPVHEFLHFVQDDILQHCHSV